MRLLPICFTLMTLTSTNAWAGWIEFGDQSLPCSSQYDVIGAAELYTATINKNGAEKVHFIKTKAEDSTCPSDSASCIQEAYLVPGDRVIVSAGSGTLACVTYISPKGPSKMGLLPAPRLDFETNFFAKLDSKEMLGTWSSDASEVSLSKGDSGFITIDGDATRGPPSYNSGSIFGPAFISSEGMTAGYEEEHYDGEKAASDPAELSGGCRVRIRSLTHYLVIDDNDRCGGQGVTFSGVYIKGPLKKREGIDD